MEIQYLIIFCLVQVVGLQIILLRKKFRIFPNYMLEVILTLINIHYLYYYFLYEGLIKDLSNLGYSIVLFSTLAPLIVYYYMISVLYGKINFTKRSIIHFIPILFNGLIFIFFINSLFDKSILLFIAKNIIISLSIIYPYLIVKTIANYYNIKGFTFKVFKFDKKKTLLIRLIVYVMLIHFFILILKNYLPLFVDGSEKTLNIIDLCYLLSYIYVIMYAIIIEPRIIHIADENIGLGGFKKYDRSNLTRAIAEDNVKILNKIMEDEKPYLDSEFSLSKFAKISNIPSHIISESLNRLLGRSFNDYVNNYRVEEFKRLASKVEYKNYTILALAFEAGFKSKSTFNASFKKFTGITPTEFFKTL